MAIEIPKEADEAAELPLDYKIALGQKVWGSRGWFSWGLLRVATHPSEPLRPARSASCTAPRTCPTWTGAS